MSTERRLRNRERVAATLLALDLAELRGRLDITQVFEDPAAETNADTLTDRVVAEIQRENTSFVEQAVWKGRRILRVSIISADTRRDHVDRLAASIVRALRRVQGRPGSGRTAAQK
jgi:glutamate/tyrosine decarboxylase-like PLP-dependent enzyme